MISVYQGDTTTLALQFATNDGTPINVSGFAIWGVAKQKYTQSNTDAIICKAVTGIDANAVTGLVYFPLTTGDTAHCPADYLFDFRVYDLNSGSSTYPTDGLRILPTTYIP